MADIRHYILVGETEYTSQKVKDVPCMFAVIDSKPTLDKFATSFRKLFNCLDDGFHTVVVLVKRIRQDKEYYTAKDDLMTQLIIKITTNFFGHYFITMSQPILDNPEYDVITFALRRPYYDIEQTENKKYFVLMKPRGLEQVISYYAKKNEGIFIHTDFITDEVLEEITVEPSSACIICSEKELKVFSDIPDSMIVPITTEGHITEEDKELIETTPEVDVPVEEVEIETTTEDLFDKPIYKEVKKYEILNEFLQVKKREAIDNEHFLLAKVSVFKLFMYGLTNNDIANICDLADIRNIQPYYVTNAVNTVKNDHNYDMVRSKMAKQNKNNIHDLRKLIRKRDVEKVAKEIIPVIINMDVSNYIDESFYTLSEKFYKRYR